MVSDCLDCRRRNAGRAAWCCSETLARAMEGEVSTAESLGVAMAAEPRAVYGEGLARSPLLVGELAVLRHRMEVAVALVRLGRHAPSDRALRSTVAALVRRCDWSRAAEGSRTLASSLLTRGRPCEAQSTLVEAERYAAAARDEAGAIEVAILRGAASTDLGKLDEAERVLYEATAAARASDDPARLPSSTLAWPLCRGRPAPQRALRPWRLARRVSPRGLPSADEKLALRYRW